MVDKRGNSRALLILAMLIAFAGAITAASSNNALPNLSLPSSSLTGNKIAFEEIFNEGDKLVQEYLDSTDEVYKNTSSKQFSDYRIRFYKSSHSFSEVNSSEISIFIKDRESWKQLSPIQEGNEFVYYEIEKKIPRLSELKIEVKK